MTSGAVPEFVYRVPGRHGGARPGAHRGRGIGAGLDIAGHARLFDQPDPRRLDLRASLHDPRGDWLVRTTRQRAAIALEAIVDVSASMGTGVSGSGLSFATDFLAALGYSAFRSGDAVGLSAFDRSARVDVSLPPRSGRGAGIAMAKAIADCAQAQATAGDTRRAGDGINGLEAAVANLAGRRAMVFIVSDFHFPLERLSAVLENLGEAQVVPLLPWDPVELEPPEGRGWVAFRDAETGARRAVWLREGSRRRWRELARARREAVDEAFRASGVTPLHMTQRFDAGALSRHFLEGRA